MAPPSNRKETFLPVVGFPGYFVSDLGRVWSEFRYKPKYLKPSTVKGGYQQLSLARDGKSFSRFVHRLVLHAFIGPCPPGMESRHLDGNPANNRLANLAWGTIIQNKADQARHGTRARVIGRRNGQAKLTPTKVRKARRLRRAGKSQREVAALLGGHQTVISQIELGKRWNHLT